MSSNTYGVTSPSVHDDIDEVDYFLSNAQKISFGLDLAELYEEDQPLIFTDEELFVADEKYRNCIKYEIMRYGDKYGGKV